MASKLSRKRAHAVSRLLSIPLGWMEVGHVTRTNLELCFSNLTDLQRERYVRESLIHMSTLFFELAQLRYWPLDRLLADVQVQGRDLISEAYQSGKGVILLVPHYGNWEILCAYLGTEFSVAALYDPPKVGSLEAVILACRERYDGRMFPISVGGMRSVLKELKQGRLVAILPDQVPAHESGTYAEFFGHAALTMTLPQQLATKTDALILMGSVERKNFGADGYSIVFEPLAGAPDQALEARINLSIEQVISRDPVQYQWEYKRFKRALGSYSSNVYRRQ